MIMQRPLTWVGPLLTAARKGEAFSLATGRPTSWERKKADTTWYEFGVPPTFRTADPLGS